MLFFLSGWTTKSIAMRIFAFKAKVGIALVLPESWQLSTWMNYYSARSRINNLATHCSKMASEQDWRPLNSESFWISLKLNMIWFKISFLVSSNALEDCSINTAICCRWHFYDHNGLFPQDKWQIAMTLPTLLFSSNHYEKKFTKSPCFGIN